MMMPVVSPTAFSSFINQQWIRIALACSTSAHTPPPLCAPWPPSTPTSRHASTSSSSQPPAASTGGQTTRSSASVASTSSSAQAQPYAGQRWAWAWVLGRQQSRKPAIKRPSRHQWHYCNPEYDPDHPLPPKMLTPYTPPSNLHQDEWQIYRNQKQHHRQPSDERYRKRFVRWLALRDVDWRNAFFEGIAADAKQRGKQARANAEAKRQRAWAEFVRKNIVPAGEQG